MNNISDFELHQKCIIDVCDSIKELLLKKNTDYQSSVFNPVKVFSNLNASERIGVRMDDKISRIMNLLNNPNLVTDETREDTINDLIGYLLLMQAAKEIEKEKIKGVLVG